MKPSGRSVGMLLTAWAAWMLLMGIPGVFNGWTALPALHQNFPPPAWGPISLLASATLWTVATALQAAGGMGLLAGASRARGVVYGGAAVGVVAGLVGVPGYLSTSPGPLAWTALGIPIGYLLMEAGVGYLLHTEAVWEEASTPRV